MFRRLLSMLIALSIACAPFSAQSKSQPYREPANNSAMTEVTGFEDAEIQAVIDQLTVWDKAKEISEIWVRINTNGGNVENGYRLAQWMEQAQHKIVCVADIKAYSMGFYLLQACDVRLMTARTTLMAHEASVSGVAGNQHELLEYVNHLKGISEGLFQHALSRMKIDEADFRAKITNKGWWFNYVEALKYGAIDGLADPRAVPPLTKPAPVQQKGLLQMLLGD